VGEESCTRNREANTLELERMHGFSAEPVPVSAYGNLEEPKGPKGSGLTSRTSSALGAVIVAIAHLRQLPLV